jgi:N-glycosylase/DNA lyase
MVGQPDEIVAETIGPTEDWSWLSYYLQLEVDLTEVIASFPPDKIMQEAVSACSGLRLLRQDPWECLASFILSSTKQICQIEQVVDLLCRRLGDKVPVPDGHDPQFSFPGVDRVAQSGEAELRACKMGFRAPYLLATARRIHEGGLNLNEVATLPYAAARARLIELPGVGEKIADCALLFGWGFAEAFPVDVWMKRVIAEHYFTKRRPTAKQLQRFIRRHFRARAGYAQQYLFHYARAIKPAALRQSGLR